MNPIQPIVHAVGQVLLDKEREIALALSCLLARGHLLIEDLPGMGKTTLAQALARVLGLDYRRVQFTSDLLPADILGVSVFAPEQQQFHFHPGPVFTQVLLADEINRTTPKTQSALLEAMEERQVTVEGETRPLPQPFFVIATQNPLFQSGTFPLPESQLDRFLMRISLGYPSAKAERQLLTGDDPRRQLPHLAAAVSGEQLAAWQQRVPQVHATDNLLDYVQRLVDHSRHHPAFGHGLSPRGTVALLRCAQAWALVHGRDHVLPEDVQTVLGPVAGHRLRATEQGGSGDDLVQQLLNDVPVVA